MALLGDREVAAAICGTPVHHLGLPGPGYGACLVWSSSSVSLNFCQGPWRLEYLRAGARGAQDERRGGEAEVAAA